MPADQRAAENGEEHAAEFFQSDLFTEKDGCQQKDENGSQTEKNGRQRQRQTTDGFIVAEIESQQCR